MNTKTLGDRVKKRLTFVNAYFKPHLGMFPESSNECLTWSVIFSVVKTVSV